MSLHLVWEQGDVDGILVELLQNNLFFIYFLDVFKGVKERWENPEMEIIGVLCK